MSAFHSMSRQGKRHIGPIAVALVLALGACDKTPPAAHAATAIATSGKRAVPTAPATSDAMQDAPLHRLMRSSGVRCEDGKPARNCRAGNADAGDYYDVELSADCGEQGFFAGVAETGGTPVLNTVPATGSNVTPRATLSQGQLVCIQATARSGQNAMYYYVVAIPTRSVAKCKDNPLCDTYGDRPIQRLSDTPIGEICHAAAPGLYIGDCVQGWVSAQALDLFSNGM